MEEIRHNNLVSTKKQTASNNDSRWLRAVTVCLLFAITILLVSIVILISNGKDETDYINKTGFQAVDVTTGSGSSGDYFGKITRITSKFVVLSNVFYLQPTNTQTNSLTTLQPLICRVDKPYGQLVINRTSVNWWVNLQNNSKVVQFINNSEKSGTPTCPTTSSTAKP